MPCNWKRIRPVRFVKQNHSLNDRLRDIDDNFKYSFSGALGGGGGVSTTAYAGKFALYTNSADQTTNLDLGDDIEVDTEEYDNTNPGCSVSGNAITLGGSGHYIILWSVSGWEMDSSSDSTAYGAAKIQIHDGSSYIGTRGTLTYSRNYSDSGNQGNAKSKSWIGGAAGVAYAPGGTTFTLQIAESRDEEDTSDTTVLATILELGVSIDIRQIG